MFKTFASAAVVTWILSLPVTAVPITFPSSTSTYSAGASNNINGFYFDPIHFVTEDFALAGLPSVNSAAFNFSMVGNQNSAAPVNFDVLVNSVTVGNFVALVVPTTQNFNLNFNFADISATAGSIYNVRFQVTNTVPGGQGAVQFSGFGSGDLSSLAAGVPELDTCAGYLPLLFVGMLAATFKPSRRQTAV